MAHPPTSTYGLTSAVASGDPDAITRFYGMYFDGILAEARRVSGRDEHFCLDVVQETMLRVLRTARGVRDEAQVVAWLKQIVRSVVVDELRREMRARRRESAAAASRKPVAPEIDQRLIWIEQELRAMPPGTVRLLTLRYRLGWTLKRIGAALGLSPGAVDGRMRRAQERLRRKYEEQHDE